MTPVRGRPGTSMHWQSSCKLWFFLQHPWQCDQQPGVKLSGIPGRILAPITLYQLNSLTVGGSTKFSERGCPVYIHLQMYEGI